MTDSRVGFVNPAGEGQVKPDNPHAEATHPTTAKLNPRFTREHKDHPDAPKLADITTRQSWADYPSKPLPNPEESETEQSEEGDRED